MAQTAAHLMFERDQASRGLGIELLSAAAGPAEVRMTVTRGADVIAEFRGRRGVISR